MVGFLLFGICPLVFLDGCGSPSTQYPLPTTSEAERPSLIVMSIASGVNGQFEAKTLKSFVNRGGYQLRYIPTFESDNDRLEMYQQLLHNHSHQPDIFEIDVIWPPLLADDLVDLKPYIGSDIDSFPPELIETYTVKGRLIAIPTFVDTGLLYYRSDLLKKYGFSGPPKTWDELERMAKAIQSGERRAGKKHFWGFVWQGQKSEALTCNALEWQVSQGGGPILNEDHTVDVGNSNSVRALERAVDWIGTISPPGVVAYGEDDSFNVWQSGNAAFLRSWVYFYGATREASGPIRDRFGVAMLPGGMGGRTRMLGGAAVSVSKYSEHRSEAISAIRHLTSVNVQRIRIVEDGSIPTRSLLQQSPDSMLNTPFHGPLAGQVMNGVISRPAVLAGKSYDKVSRAYFEAVHAALMRQMTPKEALANLQRRLVQITGFPPVHQN